MRSAVTRYVAFIGSGGTLEHVFDLTRQNLSPGTGYTNNIAWGTLMIDDGNTLELEDGLTGAPDVALYVADIIGAPIVRSCAMLHIM